MIRFYIDMKNKLGTIRQKAAAEIAVMLVVSILCCTMAGTCQNPWPWTDVERSSEVSAPPANAGGSLKQTDTAPSNGILTDTEPSDEEENGSAAYADNSVQAETVAQPELSAAEQMAMADPSPSRLNMVYEYTSDASMDPAGSYAGIAFHKLMQMDQDWVAQMYSNRSISPGTLAANLGRADEKIDRYSDWTNVGLLFFNGDGNPISGYSNAKEILSMASVYAYFEPFESLDEFLQYVEDLWKASHKYSVSIGNVYYCDGPCKYKDNYYIEDDSDASWANPGAEDIQAEASAAESSASGSKNSSSSGTVGPVGPRKYINPTTTAAAETTTETYAEETVPETSPAIPETAAPASEEPFEGTPQETISVNDETPKSPLGSMVYLSPIRAPEGAAPGDAATEEQTDSLPPEETLPPAETEESTVSGNFSGPVSIDEAKARDAQRKQSLAAEAGQTETQPAQSPEPQATAQPTQSPEPQEATAETQPTQSPETEAIAEAQPTQGFEPQATETKPAQQQPAVKIVPSTKSESICEGHINLTIRATIIGLKEESRNLLQLDERSNSDKNYTESWKGWSMLRKRCVQDLLSQDWYDLYGLTVHESMYIQNPLSKAEIEYYMDMLPEDTSAERRALVELALQSVGCIPYYWGGKPYGPGYDGNGFGTPILPDENGRSLRGLDCSGWIAWLYWTALGRHLPYESTSGLYALGKQVDRSELKPGDYIVRTGDDAHVCLFLAWAPDGTMYVIHERGSSSNNVIVSNYDLYWPYYRNLLD